MEREISAGIIIFRKTSEGPRFLLLYRGYWNFPKGKLDEGEKSFKAALREIWEETGLRAKDLVFADRFRVRDRYVYRSRKNGQKVFKTVSFYLAETHEWRIRLSSEQNGYGWFLYREALRFLGTKNGKQNLKKAHGIIVQRKDAQGGGENTPR